MAKQIKLWLLVVLLAALGGCKYEAKYGLEYNEQRKKIGLPLLEAGWKLSTVLEDHTSYTNPDDDIYREKKQAFHWSKSIYYKKGELTKEYDTYIGPGTYTTIEDGTFDEEIRISYYYKVDSVSGGYKKGWVCTLLDQSTAGSINFEKRNITLKEAEKILKRWGIERLNYNK
jgi:hypothetical protein